MRSVVRALTSREGCVTVAVMNETIITRARRIDSGEPLLLRVHDEDDVAFAVMTSVCSNPQCSCTRMGLDVRRAIRRGNAFDIEGPALGAEVSSDGTSLAINDAPGVFAPETITWIRHELGNEPSRDWLQERWSRARGQIGDPTFPSGAAPQDVDGMIFFSEVFPYEFDLIVRDGRRLYLADDQYCLKPACACDNLAVQFIDITAEDARPIGHVIASARRLKSPDVHGPAAIHRLWRDFLASFGPDRVRERFERMRRVARASPTPSVATATHAPRDAKVGRNDACPCASGKKFKRCCGA